MAGFIKGISSKYRRQKRELKALKIRVRRVRNQIKTWGGQKGGGED